MICNVKDFGAAGDGKNKDSIAIQKAIDECSENGGGKAIVTPGEYSISTLYMKSNVELHLMAGAKLQGGKSPDDYDDFKADGFKSELCPEKSAKVLIAASYCENIAITGQGEINGAGPAFYDTNIPDENRFYAKPPIPRPRMVMFFRCKNVKFEDSSFIDSPCWTFWLIACEHVNIHRIKVIGDQRMINNDGIDIDSCRNVAISDCFIKTGDDCFILRAIQRLQDEPAVCEDVTMTNCVLDSCCQGVRIGCPSDSVIRNSSFSNLVIQGCGNGININNPKCYLAPGCNGSLRLENIVFSNLIIDSERVPIWINVEEGVKLRRIGGMTFSNIRIKSNEPVKLEGSSETIIEDIRFSEIKCSNAPVIKKSRRVSLNQMEIDNN